MLPHTVYYLLCPVSAALASTEIGVSLPNSQRQHRTLRVQEDLRIVLITVPRVSRSCEHFLDGFDLYLPLTAATR